jgi:hypothetical protein
MWSHREPLRALCWRGTFPLRVIVPEASRHLLCPPVPLPLAPITPAACRKHIDLEPEFLAVSAGIGASGYSRPKTPPPGVCVIP